MPFAPTVEIRLAALRHNLKIVRRHAPRSRVMAVIKADGYGHGMLAVARALQEADAFAVARVDEGLALRHGGVDKPLLVLAGAMDGNELAAAVAADLQLVVHHWQQLDLLPPIGSADRPRCWLKLDTGMNRLGFPPGECARLVVLLQHRVELQGILTHLANADDLGDDYTRVQLQRFQQAVEGLSLATSIANSAAVLGWPQTHADWVRPGIMLYGASPFSATVRELEPVMTFKSRLLSVKTVERGAPVGYGGIWEAPETMPIGVVAAGYGDGYPREMPEGTPLLINGMRTPLVGRVSMDTLTVDLRPAGDARVGDEVVLWGRGLPTEEIAQAVRTIPYTLLCGITPRVLREYRS